MGLLVDGVWQDVWYDTKEHGGRFVRSRAQFRNWITPDGAPGPSGRGGFVAEPGRYHLYVAYACPWAHRALIFHALKGLDPMVGVSFVHWFMGEKGWTFRRDDAGVVGDRLFDSTYYYEIYLKADPSYSGRVTVPALWDKKTNTIVSNESSEIIRMFNSAFDGVGATPGDYFPQDLHADIDALNARIYNTVNNGVYKAGFATTQEAYEEALYPLFETLAWLDARLEKQRYLTGDRLTEADWRLFTTLVRFDAIYHGHFKCNLKRLADYPALAAYVRDLYQQPGVAGTLNFDHNRRHYYESHSTINPSGVVAVGPELDFDAPHSRKVMTV